MLKELLLKLDAPTERQLYFLTNTWTLNISINEWH
jgi:hypothetical protein